MSGASLKNKILMMLGRLFIPVIILAAVMAFSASIVLELITKDLIIDSAMTSVSFKGITAQEIADGTSADAKIGKLIVREIRDRYNEKVTDEEVAKIMKRLDVTGFLRAYLEKFCDWFLEHGEFPILKAEEYVDIIDQNKATIEYVIGRKLNKSFYKYQAVITRKVNAYNNKAKTVNEKYSKLLKIQKILNKSYAMAVIGVICGVLMVGYGLLRKKLGLRLYTTFRIYTFTFLIAGAALFYIKMYIKKNFLSSETLSGTVLTKIVNNVFNISGYSYLGIGVCFAIMWAAFALPYVKRKKPV